MDIAQDSNLVLFFGDLGQSNTLSEIKPPLKRQAILSFIYFSDRYDTRYILDVLWGQPIKLIQVVSILEFHVY